MSKARTVTTSVRLTPEEREQAHAAAKVLNTTFNEVVRAALQRLVRRAAKKKGGAV